MVHPQNQACCKTGQAGIGSRSSGHQAYGNFIFKRKQEQRFDKSSIG